MKPEFLLPLAIGLILTGGCLTAQKPLEAVRWRLEELNKITNKKLTPESAKRGRTLLEEGRDLCKNADTREPEAQVCIMRFQLGIKAEAMKEWGVGAELYRAALDYAENAWPKNPMRYQMQGSLATCLVGRAKGDSASADLAAAEELLHGVVAFRTDESRQILHGTQQGRVPGLDELIGARTQLGIVLRKDEKRRSLAEREFAGVLDLVVKHTSRVRDPEVLWDAVAAAEISDKKEKVRIVRAILATLEVHFKRRMDLRKLCQTELVALGEKDIWTIKPGARKPRTMQIGK